ncbi:MFS transporter [Corynebacterium alimapuense]|uniref:MFS transporter n=1 Tax=Corynebacterium alimapuense TaxID=1576874 RepID=A0A3M8KAX3_9CORY|nr:MFS transporter [Corynebacterium alimapuense]RNE49935.1 MFS transporter [Corynebacterium alimapuense]
MNNFRHILANTLVANVTTSYLWFALTFWVYLETGNVGLAGVLNGLYMGLIAVGSIFFGSIVDHNLKKNVMLFAATCTLVCFGLAAMVWVIWVTEDDVSATNPALIVFSALVLIGAVVEHMRNIALSTTVTLLIPENERDKANGWVGTIQGASFFATSILAGVSIGYIGMEATMWIALGLTLVTLVHLIPIKIPESRIITSEETTLPATGTDTVSSAPSVPSAPSAPVSSGIDLHGSFRIIALVPGLLALILFTSFNNFIGGAYTALMDPYGLELFSPQVWGLVLGVTSLGFIIGGALVGKFGLGANPVRTLLLVNVGMATLGMVFGLREWWWLYAGGIFLFMLTIPAAEAAEQTILQRVVPYRQQGRVFGLAMSVELAANPLSTIIIAVVAQAYVIPWMATDSGQQWFGWLLGEGDTRGMALMFAISGLILLIVVILAFFSKPYRQLSEYYASTSQDIAGHQANSLATD